MEIVKSIIEKMKIKEILGVAFITSILISFMPYSIAEILKLVEFRENYQTYLTVCIIVTGSFYLYKLFKYVSLFFLGYIFNNKRLAINYMKKSMSPDEMGLLVQTFYDLENNRFKSNGIIDLMDGRRTPLESKKVIYRASELGSAFVFSYNLQPYALEFLNQQLSDGNITITNSSITWNFK